MSDAVVQEIVYAAKAEGAGDDERFSPGETIEVDGRRSQQVLRVREDHGDRATLGNSVYVDQPA